MNNDIKKLIIIGSGPASLTAAIYAARAHLDPLVIEGSNPGGQLMGTSAIENWPGTMHIMGPQLMMNIKEHAQHFGTEFLSETVTNIDTSVRPFTITTDKNRVLKSHSIIIATGATAKRLHIPGEDTYWGKGVSTCAICDGLFFKNKKVVIVGGGDTAMENASFMTKFTDDITIIHILDKLTASATMQKRVLDNPNIKIIYNSTVTAIDGNGNVVTNITIANQKTKEKSKLEVDGVFIAIGYAPNTNIFKNKIDTNVWGYIDLKKETQTSVEGIFAAGDVADFRYRQAITAAGSGCMAALDAEHWLRSQNI
jgi:thioredoxin reductase (NADPH)